MTGLRKTLVGLCVVVGVVVMGWTLLTMHQRQDKADSYRAMCKTALANLPDPAQHQEAADKCHDLLAADIAPLVGPLLFGAAFVVLGLGLISRSGGACETPVYGAADRSA